MLQISLRQLLILVAFIALAIVSLKYATNLWQALVGLVTMIATFAAILVGAFDRGPRQVFAIGFAVVLLAYSVLVASGRKMDDLHVQNVEMFASIGRLPTTILLSYAHKFVARKVVLNAEGEPMPASDPA